MTRIVIATGGTAGHVVPALAVAHELTRSGGAVTFIGGDRAEADLVPRAGYEFAGIRVRGLDRRNPFKAGRAIGLAAAAVPRARLLLEMLRPDVVVGGGGYVAFPVAAAALMRGIPLVLTEADRHLGITNRILARFAKRVCLAFAIPGRTAAKYVVTGRPVAAEEMSVDRSGSLRLFGLKPGDRTVVVFGGSLGARSINKAAIEAFAPRYPGFQVIHISGVRDFDTMDRRLAEVGRPSHYRLFDYLEAREFGAALVAADLALARSGGSVFELAATGTPAVLVPYPHAAGDHQTQNAEWMAHAGAATILPDADLSTERVATEIQELLGEPARLADMALAARGLARPGAAIQVAAEVLAVAVRGA